MALRPEEDAGNHPTPPPIHRLHCRLCSSLSPSTPHCHCLQPEPLQIVYLIIIADVLVGVPPDYNGLITNLLGIHDPNGGLLSAPAAWQPWPPRLPAAACWAATACGVRCSPSWGKQISTRHGPQYVSSGTAPAHPARPLPAPSRSVVCVAPLCAGAGLPARSGAAAEPARPGVSSCHRPLCLVDGWYEKAYARSEKLGHPTTWACRQAAAKHCIWLCTIRAAAGCLPANAACIARVVATAISLSMPPRADRTRHLPMVPPAGGWAP